LNDKQGNAAQRRRADKNGARKRTCECGYSFAVAEARWRASYDRNELADRRSERGIDAAIADGWIYLNDRGDVDVRWPHELPCKNDLHWWAASHVATERIRPLHALLQRPDLRSHAMRTLRAPTVELPRHLVRLAQHVLPLIALVAEGEVSEPRAQEAVRLFAAIDRALNGDRNRTWCRALERQIFGTPELLHPMGESTKRGLVGLLDSILDFVHQDVGDDELPPALSPGRFGGTMTRRSAAEYRECLRRAARRLGELRITQGKAGGRGGLVSPWGAAREIATCFGLHMPDRASEKTRDYSKLARTSAKRTTQNRTGNNAP
jgi:hypothetical protein